MKNRLVLFTFLFLIQGYSALKIDCFSQISGKERSVQRVIQEIELDSKTELKIKSQMKDSIAKDESLVVYVQKIDSDDRYFNIDLKTEKKVKIKKASIIFGGDSFLAPNGNVMGDNTTTFFQRQGYGIGYDVNTARENAGSFHIEYKTKKGLKTETTEVLCSLKIL